MVDKQALADVTSLPNSATSTTLSVFVKFILPIGVLGTILDLILIPPSTTADIRLQVGLQVAQWFVLATLAMVFAVPYTPRTLSICTDGVVVDLRRRGLPSLRPGKQKIAWRTIVSVQTDVWTFPGFRTAVPLPFGTVKERFFLTRENALLLRDAWEHQYQPKSIVTAMPHVSG